MLSVTSGCAVGDVGHNYLWSVARLEELPVGRSLP